MRKIKLYIAASIDGYIADINGELDWLKDYPINSDYNYGYDDFFESVDSVIIGGKTFRDILNMDISYPYKEKTTYIVSQTNNFPTSIKNIEFISDKIAEKIFSLKRQKGKDIWLVGGGQLISMLINYNLVDEMKIAYIPKLLGEGIPLFPKMTKETKWQLTNNQSYKNGVVSIEYQKIS